MGSPVVVWKGCVEEGKVNFDDKVGVMAWTKRLEGERIEVVIRKAKRKRSGSQNAYWWSVVIELMAGYMGDEDKTAVHYALLGHWKGVREVGGIPVPNCVSSSALTTADFTELIDWVRIWALTHHNVMIPAPGGVEL